MNREINGLFPLTIVLSYCVAIMMIVYGVMIYNNFFESIATVAMVLIIVLAIIYGVLTTLLFVRNKVLEHVYIWVSTFIGVILLLVELSQGFKFSPLMVYGIIICLLFLGFNIFMHANYFVNGEVLGSIFKGAPLSATPRSMPNSLKGTSKANIKVNINKKKK